jgi:DNA-binding transcriptional LysR family regulator
MLDVRKMDLLRELARLGTIAAVAQTRFCTPSAVSQQLSALEREAGVPLIRRSGRGVELTAAGTELADRTGPVLALLEQALAALAATRGEITGKLRIGVFPTAVRTVLPPALVTLGAEHPRLELRVTELDPAGVPDALRTGVLDIALVHEYDYVPAEPDPALASWPLLDETIFLASAARPADGSGHAASGRSAPRTGPAGEAPAGERPAGAVPAGEVPADAVPAGERPAGEVPAGERPAGEVPAGERPAGAWPVGEVPVGEGPAGAVPAGEVPAGEVPVERPTGELAADAVLACREQPWIAASPGTLCHLMTVRLCQAAGFTPRVRHYADDFAAVLTLVAAGQGVALVPELAIGDSPAGVRLAPLTARRRTLIACRSGAAGDPAITAFTAAIRAATAAYRGPAAG